MPYIISGMVMIAMFYVMMFLDNSTKRRTNTLGGVIVDVLGIITSVGVLTTKSAHRALQQKR